MSDISDLNSILFERIKAINDSDLSNEKLEMEIKKAEATTSLANVIVKNATVALAAQKHFDEYGTGRTVDIPLLGVSNKNLMAENKRLRRDLGGKLD